MPDEPEEAQETTSKEFKVDKARVQAWLKERWKGSKDCPVSGHNEWVIGDHLVQPLNIVGPRAVGVGGPGYPLVLVICGGCGYTMLFNAVLLGLLEDSNGNE